MTDTRKEKLTEAQRKLLERAINEVGGSVWIGDGHMRRTAERLEARGLGELFEPGALNQFFRATPAGRSALAAGRETK